MCESYPSPSVIESPNSTKYGFASSHIEKFEIFGTLEEFPLSQLNA